LNIPFAVHITSQVQLLGPFSPHLQPHPFCLALNQLLGWRGLRQQSGLPVRRQLQGSKQADHLGFDVVGPDGQLVAPAPVLNAGGTAVVAEATHGCLGAHHATTLPTVEQT
jgi:hypothetical protein